MGAGSEKVNSSAVLAFMQAAARSAEARKQAALAGESGVTNVEDQTSAEDQSKQQDLRSSVGDWAQAAPSHGKSDFILQHLMELVNQQNQPTGTRVQGEIPFLKDDYKNKKVSIKISVTDTETGNKQKSRINIGFNGTGTADMEGDSGMTEATNPLERASVVIFSNIAEGLDELLQEITSRED
jgi:hypothetical protein